VNWLISAGKALEKVIIGLTVDINATNAHIAVAHIDVYVSHRCNGAQSGTTGPRRPFLSKSFLQFTRVGAETLKDC